MGMHDGLIVAAACALIGAALAAKQIGLKSAPARAGSRS